MAFSGCFSKNDKTWVFGAHDWWSWIWRVKMFEKFKSHLRLLWIWNMCWIEQAFSCLGHLYGDYNKTKCWSFLVDCLYSKLIINSPSWWEENPAVLASRHHRSKTIPSLKLTCLPLKINRLKFLLRWPIFKRKLLVSRIGYPGENLTMGGVGHLKWI